MKRHISEPIKTYTIGFPGTKLRDERLLAREIVKAVRTDHTEIEFSEQDFWSLLPQVMKALDDPTLDFATLPTYKMASIAKNDVKVILCGEGGDEILGGYGRYQKAKLPSLLGGRLFTGYGMLESQGLLRRENMGWKETFQKTLQQDIDPHYTRLQKAQAIDISFWLPNDLLTKLDRCLMAHGVEGRTPFLDLPLAKTVFNLPDRMKIHWRTRKWLLRKWLHKNLPVADPFSHKRGFTVPVCEWMDKRRDDLADLVSQQAGIQQLCYPEVVRKLYLSSNLRTQNARWNLLSFALWHQIHIVDFAPAEDVFVTLASH